MEFFKSESSNKNPAFAHQIYPCVLGDHLKFCKQGIEKHQHRFSDFSIFHFPLSPLIEKVFSLLAQFQILFSLCKSIIEWPQIIILKNPDTFLFHFLRPKIHFIFSPKEARRSLHIHQIIEKQNHILSRIKLFQTNFFHPVATLSSRRTPWFIWQFCYLLYGILSIHSRRIF